MSSPSSASRNSAIFLLALILISPLFSFPRPINVSSIPWRVELFFAAFIVAVVIFGSRQINFELNFGRFIGSLEVRTLLFGFGSFVAWSLVSCLWAGSWSSALHHTFVWGNYILVFVLTCVFAKIGGGRSQIIRLFACVAIFLGVLAVFDFATMQDFTVQEGTLRIRYAKFAELLITITPLLFAVGLFSKTKLKLVGVLAVASAAWIGVMLSLSKGAFIAGTVGIMAFFIFVALFRPDYRLRAAYVAASWIVLTFAFQAGFSQLTAIPSTTDYISGKHESGPSTSDMRIYTWKVARKMIGTNLILGVGGDNFGLAFNQAREELAAQNPNDPDSAIGEDYVFERAHNELIQIAAELGLFGILIFTMMVVAALAMFAREIWQRSLHLSPIFYAAIAGVIAFCASSLFSSFSFRAFQNGIVFFMLLGLATSYLKGRRGRFSTLNGSRIYIAFGLRTITILMPVMLLIFSVTKAASQYTLLIGERSTDLETALAFFESASKLDQDNPGAELAAAGSLVREKQWPSAVPHFRRSIDGGYGISLIYSYMANAQEMTGDLSSAEATLREAASIFPRSTFIRARLAIVLEKQGQMEEAMRQLAIGRSYNLQQTNGWYSVIKDGILNAHLKATSDPSYYSAPPELRPQDAIYFYNDEKVRVD